MQSDVSSVIIATYDRAFYYILVKTDLSDRQDQKDQLFA